MQFLAWLKANSLAWRDGHFCTGPGVAANSSLPWPHVKYPKPAQLNAVARSKGLLEAFKDRIDSRFGLIPRQPGLCDHLMDDVLFYQCFSPPAAMLATSSSYSEISVWSSV